MIGYSKVRQVGKKTVETTSVSLAGWEIALLGGTGLLAYWILRRPKTELEKMTKEWYVEFAKDLLHLPPFLR